MIKNYIKTAWRNLLRNKSYAAINILGLAVGNAACLLIFLIVQFEASFDDFHSKKDHIYRLNRVFNGPEGVHPKITSILKNMSAITDFPLKLVSSHAST